MTDRERSPTSATESAEPSLAAQYTAPQLAPNGVPESPARPDEPEHGRDPASVTTADPYRGVMLVLLAAATLGATGALVAAFAISNAVLLEISITLGLSAGVLFGVILTRSRQGSDIAPVIQVVALESDSPPPRDVEGQDEPSGLGAIAKRTIRWRPALGGLRETEARIGGVGIGALIIAQLFSLPPLALAPLAATIVGVVCLVAAGLSATAVRYLTSLPAEALPEAAGLAKGGRIVAWCLTLGAASIAAQWGGLAVIVQGLALVITAVNLAFAVSVRRASKRVSDHVDHEVDHTFALDLAVLDLLGSRVNVLASLLDAAEEQLGIDLRSTWALTIVRRSIEPLAIGLAALGWLSTSLTVVSVDEQGLVERLGVPVQGEPLGAGIHVHWPWPVDRVSRIPVQRVQALTVGHEGQENGGPEDVLWAKEHAANEYTLLLGNGRDLITVDAAVQFRIVDARAWRYHTQNPSDALRAIAYRAVMRNTVNRTLTEALSENLVATTARMREMVQRDANALGLGVDVLGFTVGGMHPPVMVAADYQSVVSAELGKTTAVVKAQVYRNQTVPYAQSSALVNANTARADSALGAAKALGEAWSFRALEAQYHASPEDFLFRRRLETLEHVLATKRYTILDSRFQRDGGELWMIP